MLIPVHYLAFPDGTSWYGITIFQLHPPIDITVDGRDIKAGRSPSRDLHVFDRITGEPVWPIEEGQCLRVRFRERIVGNTAVSNKAGPFEPQE